MTTAENIAHDTTVPRQWKLLLTAEEAADVLGIGRSKVYELMASGRLRSVQIGRLRRIPAARLELFVATLEDDSV